MAGQYFRPGLLQEPEDAALGPRFEAGLRGFAHDTRLCFFGRVEIIIIMTNAGTLINLYYNLRTYSHASPHSNCCYLDIR